MMKKKLFISILFFLFAWPSYCDEIQNKENLIKQLEGPYTSWKYAAREMARSGDRSFAPHLAKLLAKITPDLNQNMVEVYEQIFISLGTLKNKEVIDNIAEVKTDSIRLKKAAIWALGEIGDSRGADYLIANLYAEDPLIKRETIWAIGKTRNKLVIKPLLRGFPDSPASIRGCIALVLGDICGKENLPELQKEFENEDRMWVKEKIFLAIKKIKSREGVK